VAGDRIERADLEASIVALQDELVSQAERGKRSIVGTFAAVAGVALVVAYLVGRRSGRRRGGIIEIRR
jgi:hypothetical protein